MFRHPDFVETRREVQVKADKPTKVLRVDLTAGEGGISVRGGKAGLRIFVDDRSSGQTTPGVVRGLKPGRHKIELREGNGTTVVATRSVVVANLGGQSSGAVLTQLPTTVESPFPLWPLRFQRGNLPR